MNNRLRIGTRGSALALWQARWVQTLLNTIGVKSELVPIDATGDKELQKPLYEMGFGGGLDLTPYYLFDEFGRYKV